MKQQSLAEKLINSGLCQDTKQAAAFIMAGKVLVNDRPAKAGSLVKKIDVIRVKDVLPYASKGGLKLSGALRVMEVAVEGKVCLDAGASTGGFTDCLLQSGAALVYAVDVGFGQLTGKLRQENKVVNLEKTNISDESLLSLNPRPSFATCDLSYLSLRSAVPLYKAIMHGEGEILALVKPLFEIEDSEAKRSGQVEDTAYEPLLLDLVAGFNAMPGTGVRNVCASPVTGNAGTLEFFLHIGFGDNLEKPDLGRKIAGSVQSALQTHPYTKAGDIILD